MSETIGHLRHALSWRKRLVFSLIPVTLLFAAAELTLRVLDRDDSFITLPEDDSERPDPDLFWTMSPNSGFVMGDGTEVRTNSLGLRYPEIPPKAPGEVRILSLGESTTFGARVRAEETYSARLESLLNEAAAGGSFRVINAGVSVYSSFQSLRYLQLRGLDLQPDIVLFYHEINDFIPTTESRYPLETSADRRLTDRELLHSRTHRFHRHLLACSAVYRALTSRLLREKYKDLPSDFSVPPAGEATIPSITINTLVSAGESEIFHRRVPSQDRLLILDELKRTCVENGITLVVIHPSYRDTVPHECELTWFCRDSGTLMFEAHPSLHSGAAGSLFRDFVHPNAEGHARLARDLFAFLGEHALVRPKLGAPAASGSVE